VTSEGEKVVLVGSVVRLRSHDETTEDITIVDSPEDVGLYRLSTRTPLGGALLGHREGELVTVVTPHGATAKYTIVSIIR